jgi:succinate dehydrogenase flavin-adding protein (antitoxin of CptAB toxin-antitoxin module)
MEVSYMGMKKKIAVDMDIHVSKFLAMAARQFKIPQDKLDEYGLLLASDDNRAAVSITNQRKWLDTTKRLSECASKTVTQFRVSD